MTCWQCHRELAGHWRACPACGALSLTNVEAVARGVASCAVRADTSRVRTRGEWAWLSTVGSASTAATHPTRHGAALAAFDAAWREGEARRLRRKHDERSTPVVIDCEPTFATDETEPYFWRTLGKARERDPLREPVLMGEWAKAEYAPPDPWRDIVAAYDPGTTPLPMARCATKLSTPVDVPRRLTGASADCVIDDVSGSDEDWEPPSAYTVRVPHAPPKARRLHERLERATRDATERALADAETIARWCEETGGHFSPCRGSVEVHIPDHGTWIWYDGRDRLAFFDWLCEGGAPMRTADAMVREALRALGEGP